MKRTQLSNWPIKSQNQNKNKPFTNYINRELTNTNSNSNLLYLESPGEGGTPRNDEADLGRREGLFIADLNTDNAGFDKDRHREAILSDKRNECEAEILISRLTTNKKERGVFSRFNQKRRRYQTKVNDKETAGCATVLPKHHTTSKIVSFFDQLNFTFRVTPTL